MCKILRIARSTYYYDAAGKPEESRLSEAIKTLFHRNRRAYGSRKIKVELNKISVFTFRWRISRIMKENDLHSDKITSKYKSWSKPNVPFMPRLRVNNMVIEEVVDIFYIWQSLAFYDNAVTVSAFKLFKTEFIEGCNFNAWIG